ncbi:flavin reductase family protein [Microvirga tunisiensis]|uniref:Flavin reductase family protein n=2 Tax=Pannonibacter tanglangensis TaxID=2750084 RepID=A0ABW9ZFM5_9HYPH|nr:MULTISPECIES: flavin reductase family protein [unclassified Pannonibacter]NBN63655.1 flavin reductase family protein [Pannonibacter sp. XCT-34]NBN77289.1 flavin reductase family protein [Pannonibacter sp. XCT-53]
MFFAPGEHKAAGLSHNPFKALVAPRPIGWISTLDAEGRANLAPYSFFNAVDDAPPIVMFSSSGWKNTVANVEATGEFVCNIATEDLARQMNTTSASVPAGVDEFELAGLAKAPSRLVRAPRVAAAKAALECRLLQVVELTALDGTACDARVVFGQVIGLHVSEDVVVDGRIDMARLGLLARLGYMDYAVTREVFAMNRPGA